MSGDSESVARVLTVRAGRGTYGIPLESVREIVRDLRVVPLAGAPERVLGLAGFRGEPLAVIALAGLAGSDVSRVTEGAVVVVDLGDEGSVGLAVDRVAGVRRVAPDRERDRTGPFIGGTADGEPISMLAIDRMRASRGSGEA